jgi:putative acetyltransferase
MGLALMATVPQYERKGMGSALVQTGLKRCRQFGSGAVVVLEHPCYYLVRVLGRYSLGH